MKKKKDIQTRSNEFGKSFLKDIRKEMDLYEQFEEVGEHEKADEINEEIQTSHYGVSITKRIEIILGGGGPAMKIVYNLETETGEILFQDWFEEWTPAQLTMEEQETLDKYVERFFVDWAMDNNI